MDPLLGHTPISNSFPGDSEWYPRGFHRLLDVLMFRIDRHVVALCDLLNCLELLRENTRILLRCLLQVWILSRLGLGLELLHILQEIFRNRLDVFFIELRARQPLQLGDQLLVFLGWLFGRTNLKLLCDRLELIVEFRAILREMCIRDSFIYCAGNKLLFSWFNGFGLTALLIGVACSTALTKRIGKRTLFFWSMLLTGIFCILLFFLPATATVPIITLEVLRQFVYGCSGPVLWAMMGDVADFGEWKTGRRATATVTAAVVFALWIGLALGGAIAGWLLSFYGYQPNAEQTAHALLGIRLIASVYAGAAFLAAAVCLLFYGISMKLNLTISHDLTERRKGYSSPAS